MVSGDLKVVRGDEVRAYYQGPILSEQGSSRMTSRIVPASLGRRRLPFRLSADNCVETEAQAPSPIDHPPEGG
jgi:hypothetical protein